MNIITLKWIFVGVFISSGKAEVHWTVWRSKGTNDTDYMYLWSNQAQVTWDQAVYECRKHNWRLAKILNEKEDNFLRNQLRKVNGRSSWIGLQLETGSTLDYQTGNWSDGTPFIHNTSSPSDYAKWDAGEPQSATRMNTCVHLFKSHTKDYNWDDYGCAYNRSIICQVDVGKIPTLLPNISIHSSTKQDMDMVVEVVHELMRRTSNLTGNGEILKTVDDIVEKYEGDDYYSSTALLSITINSTRRGDSLSFGSDTDDLHLSLSKDVIEEAFSCAGYNRSVLSISSILYKRPAFFQANTSTYTDSRASVDNTTYETQPILPDPFMNFGEDEIFRLPPTNAVGSTISATVSNVTMRNLTNWIQVTSSNVCQNTNTEFIGYKGVHQIRCSFWDITKQQWSQEGCTTQLSTTHHQSRCYNVTCRCNHMTHFTIVFDSAYIYAPTYLNYTTITGSVICGIFLLITCITILSLRHMRHDVNKCIVFNISLNLFLFQMMFLIGIDRDSTSTEWCDATSYLLHLFTLTSWFWMLVESVYLLLALCLREHSSSRVKKMMFGCGIIAYAVPILIASLTISLQRPYLSPKYCWLGSTTVFHTVVIPIMCILTINIFVGGFAMYTMICAPKVAKTLRNMAKIRQTVRRIIYLSFLLGFPWILGLAMLLAQDSSTKTIFSLLFTVFLTLQGIVIFSAFCASDDIFKTKVKSAFARCQRGFSTIPDGSSDYSHNTSSDNQHSNKTTETDRVTRNSKRKLFRVSDAAISGSSAKPVSSTGSELKEISQDSSK